MVGVVGDAWKAARDRGDLAAAAAGLGGDELGVLGHVAGAVDLPAVRDLVADVDFAVGVGRGEGLLGVRVGAEALVAGEREGADDEVVLWLVPLLDD